MKIPFNIKPNFNKSTYSSGLDIGNNFIKAVKLKVVSDKIELVGFALEPQQPEPEALIRKTIQLQEIKKVNISVSGPQTVIRYAEFPKMSENEFRQALKFEAQKHIPFQLSEVNVDGAILRSDLPNNKMLVLLAAVKKDFLGSRLKLYESVGAKVNIVDIDSLSLINAFNFNYRQEQNLKDKTIALIDIGAQESKLNILNNFIPTLSRDMHIAGHSITQKIADILTIDFASAENLKINPSENSLAKVTSAAESVLSNLAREIRTSFDYYESQNASSVSRIFLSGGGALFVGIKEALTNLLGIEVEFWDPFRNIEIEGSVDSERVKASASQLAVAVGLALRA